MHRILKCANYYEVLDISLTASRDEITKNYRSLELLVHPDKNPDKDAETAAKSALLPFYSLVHFTLYKFVSWKFQNLILIILLRRLLSFIIFQGLFNYTDSVTREMWWCEYSIRTCTFIYFV